MSPAQRNNKLQEFVYRLEKGYSIPMHLLEFMAEGARAALKNEKPWPVKQGRQPKWSNYQGRCLCLQIFAMKHAGISTVRTVELLSLFNEGREEQLSEKTLRRYYKEAEKMLGRCVNVPAKVPTRHKYDLDAYDWPEATEWDDAYDWHDAYELRHAVELLLELETLKKDERKLMEAFQERIKFVPPKECGYGH